MEKNHNEQNLNKIALEGDDWKHLKLAVLYNKYGRQAEAWNELFPPVSDDRRVYINIYNQLKEAIESLTDNPHNVVCVAMNQYIRSETAVLDEIKATFSNR